MSKAAPDRRGLEAELARLRAGNERLSALVRQPPNIAERTANLIFVLDPETGRLTSGNDRFEELLGYSRAELTAPGFDFLARIAPGSLDLRERTVLRQKRVIRNLLELARLESGRRVPRPGPVRFDEAASPRLRRRSRAGGSG